MQDKKEQRLHFQRLHKTGREALKTLHQLLLSSQIWGLSRQNGHYTLGPVHVISKREVLLQEQKEGQEKLVGSGQDCYESLTRLMKQYTWSFLTSFGLCSYLGSILTVLNTGDVEGNQFNGSSGFLKSILKWSIGPFLIIRKQTRYPTFLPPEWTNLCSKMMCLHWRYPTSS